MTKTKSLSIDLLRTDADTQCRVAINEETVEDYTEIIEANGRWPLGPIDVFHDGTNYIVADGFHRTLAAQRAKRGSIPCTIHKGTARDARLFGMTANDGHGLRMSRADKRACVEWLLDNEKMTQVAIAEAAGVSVRTVKYIIHYRKNPKGKKGQIAPSNTQDVANGKDGRTDSGARRAKEPSSRSPRSGKDRPGTLSSDELGQCPNCAGKKWTKDMECVKCGQPHGEPAGDVDEDRVDIQKKKTVKTAEALMRAFDDLHLMVSRTKVHGESVASCKALINVAKGWK